MLKLKRLQKSNGREDPNLLSYLFPLLELYFVPLLLKCFRDDISKDLQVGCKVCSRWKQLGGKIGKGCDKKGRKSWQAGQ